MASIPKTQTSRAQTSRVPRTHDWVEQVQSDLDLKILTLTINLDKQYFLVDAQFNYRLSLVGLEWVNIFSGALLNRGSTVPVSDLYMR